MKSMTWCAALLAAVILAIGLFALPRASVAGMNDDVEFLQPPSDAGDPDGPTPISILSGWLQPITRFVAWRTRAPEIARSSSAGSRPVRIVGQSLRTQGRSRPR